MHVASAALASAPASTAAAPPSGMNRPASTPPHQIAMPGPIPLPANTSAAAPTAMVTRSASAPPGSLGSGEGGRRISEQDIQLVQNLIERCLQLSLSQREVVSTLQAQAKIEPGFTVLVWQKLEEQNPEFFRAYHLRLKVKEQVVLFNYLLEQQVTMVTKLHMSWLQALPPMMPHPGMGQPGMPGMPGSFPGFPGLPGMPPMPGMPGMPPGMPLPPRQMLQHMAMMGVANGPAGMMPPPFAAHVASAAQQQAQAQAQQQQQAQQQYTQQQQQQQQQQQLQQPSTQATVPLPHSAQLLDPANCSASSLNGTLPGGPADKGDVLGGDAMALDGVCRDISLMGDALMALHGSSGDLEALAANFNGSADAGAGTGMSQGRGDVIMGGTSYGSLGDGTGMDLPHLPKSFSFSDFGGFELHPAHLGGDGLMGGGGEGLLSDFDPSNDGLPRNFSLSDMTLDFGALDKA